MKPCYIQYGSIYTQSGCIIETPAILIDRTNGIILKWGEADVVLRKYAELTKKCDAAGLSSMADSMMCITMNDCEMTRDQQCYILRRCLEYAATTFPISLCQHIINGDCISWLNDEMHHFQIDLEQQK